MVVIAVATLMIAIIRLWIGRLRSDKERPGTAPTLPGQLFSENTDRTFDIANIMRNDCEKVKNGWMSLVNGFVLSP
ncbi:MAG: hypothetical protein R6V38_05170 [Roseovarius gahaiensis]